MNSEEETDLTEDEHKAVLWACEQGIRSLLNEGFPDPGKSNAEILRSASNKLQRKRYLKPKEQRPNS